MKYTKYILITLLIIITLAITACNQNNQDQTIPENNQTQEQQCDLDKAETYCPSENRCMQVWKEYCEDYSEYYEEPGMCTKEYMPVKGDITFPCNDGECTTQITFGNRCEAETAGAQNIEPINNQENSDNMQVTNFKECVDAGNPIMESHPRQCIHEGELFTEKLDFDEMNLSDNKYEACENLGGKPLPDYNECEYISQDACEYLGGDFKECESACRNDPDAEMCTMECVQVCALN